VEQGPRFEFPSVSDEGLEVPTPFAEVGAGVSILRDERLYDAADDGFGKGERSGIVHIEERKTSELGEGTVVCRVVFRFFDERDSTLTASGVLPHNGAQTVGEGRLAIVGGTGKFKTTRGELVVLSENPKRWSIDDSP